jgi:hypothetical protein
MGAKTGRDITARFRLRITHEIPLRDTLKSHHITSPPVTRAGHTEGARREPPGSGHPLCEPSHLRVWPAGKEREILTTLGGFAIRDRARQGCSRAGVRVPGRRVACASNGPDERTGPAIVAGRFVVGERVSALRASAVPKSVSPASARRKRTANVSHRCQPRAAASEGASRASG